MYFFKGGGKSSRPEKYLAAQPEKKALLPAPTKHRHSSHWQEAVPYIALARGCALYCPYWALSEIKFTIEGFCDTTKTKLLSCI